MSEVSEPHPASAGARHDTPPRRELTLRALLTGVLLGVALTPANVYSGLKIGFTFNMSIIALLASYAFWRGLALGPGWNQYESNITQTTASSAASIISGGLVAPIPAYLLLTGEVLSPGTMMAWVFAVSFLGIWVAWYLRPVLIVGGSLRFPAGIATLETLRDIFSAGREALARLAALGTAAACAALIKAIDSFWVLLPRWSPSAALERYTFTLDPSPLLLGFGAIIGTRTGLSLLAGAILAWALAPALVDAGIVALPATGSGFAALVEWLLWPGVALMVSATITTLLVRLGRIGMAPAGSRGGITLPRPRAWPLLGLAAAALLVTVLQVRLFGIAPLLAVLAVPVAIVLAAVAARVVGETGIPPIGAIGKVSQLTFGVAAPAEPITNLMAANVAGGAAGQGADLLNDFRVGHGIGAAPAAQAAAQCCGVLAGSITGTMVFLLLIPDPGALLLTEEWPAPAVATWKAVAEVLAGGLASIPISARWAVLGGATGGCLLGVLEQLLPPRVLRFLPSGTAMGLAFVLPASISVLMAAGAIITWVAALRFPAFAARFALAIAAGLVAGESLMGVFAAFWDMLR